MSLITRLITLSLLLPATAFAHMVPYNTAAFMNAAEGNADKALSIAIFCKTLNKDEQTCLSDVNGINDQGIVDVIAKCGDGLKNYHSNFDDRFAHKVGSSGAPDRGFWHTGYVESKDEGAHRHAWSEAAQQINRDEYVTQRLINYKNSFSGNSSTSTSTSTEVRSIGSNGSINGDAKLLGAGIGASGGVTTGKSEETSKSNVKTGPSESQMNEERVRAEKAFDENAAYVSPSDPDIYCSQSSRTCITPTGSIPNESYAPPSSTSKPASSKKEEKQKNNEGPQSGGKSTPKTTDNNNAFPKNNSAEHPNMYAGEPMENKPGESYAHYSQEEVGEGGLERCMKTEYEKLRQLSFATEYMQEGKENNEQRYKEAQENLNLGICDKRILGQDFCHEFNFKKDAHWDQEAKTDAEKTTKTENSKGLIRPCHGGVFQDGQCISIDNQDDLEGGAELELDPVFGEMLREHSYKYRMQFPTNPMEEFLLPQKNGRPSNPPSDDLFPNPPGNRGSGLVYP